MEIAIAPGPGDLITDVPGLAVGHAGDERLRSGTTVLLPDEGARMAVDVRGGAPGTRETDALDPVNLVEVVHALVLSGGSVFGLAAADAVTEELSARGIGLAIAPRPVPVVPAAILFDLANGGDKSWQGANPYHRLGRQALARVSHRDRCGRVGAGTGARAGDQDGGYGSASLTTAGPDRLLVGAAVAVNSFGPRDAGRRDHIPLPKAPLLGTNTTIAVVATDIMLDKTALKRMAIMAHDGLARRIRPIHTPFDGDTVFALSTGRRPAPNDLPPALLVTILGTLAADALARAVDKALDAA
ncbi:MAG: peptidase S58 family protein [Alphaproteobacteria bacterium]|nr:MAG: peptidase S58 family protein [Alphaproteobacteria bacterium]